MYAIRRIKDGFRMHKTESDKATIEQLCKEAEHSYQVIQRQVSHFLCMLFENPWDFLSEVVAVILMQLRLWYFKVS